jgi:hypothetical protein
MQRHGNVGVLADIGSGLSASSPTNEMQHQGNVGVLADKQFPTVSAGTPTLP